MVQGLVSVVTQVTTMTPAAATVEWPAHAHKECTLLTVAQERSPRDIDLVSVHTVIIKLEAIVSLDNAALIRVQL